MSEPTDSPADAIEQRASIRRAPKVPVFMVLGALLGVLTALVLTSVFEVDPLVGFGATFGYLCVYFIPAGLVLGAVLALVFDRVSRRGAREVTIARDTVREPLQTVERAEPDALIEPVERAEPTEPAGEGDELRS